MKNVVHLKVIDLDGKNTLCGIYSYNTADSVAGTTCKRCLGVVEQLNSSHIGKYPPRFGKYTTRKDCGYHIKM